MEQENIYYKTIIRSSSSYNFKYEFFSFNEIFSFFNLDIILLLIISIIFS